MSENLGLMLRPKNITPGNVPLTTNLLKLTVPDLSLCHYAVSIEPALQKRLNPIIIKNVIDKHTEKLKNVVYGYDNNAMFVTNKRIDNIEQEEKVGSKTVVVRIEFKNEYKLDDSTGMQCLEIILRSYQASKFHLDGRKTVSPQLRESLSGCIEIWYGISQRVKALNGGLFLNVDVAHCFFYEPIPLIQVLEKQGARRRGDRVNLKTLRPEVFRDLSKFVKMVRLETVHRERNPRFKAVDITVTSAEETFFEVEGKKESVAQYFQRAYGPLHHPYLPCLVVKKRDSQIFLPLEVVKICDSQKYAKRLNDFQTSEMIKKVSKPAAERFNDLNTRVRNLEVSSNPTLSTMKVQVAGDFYQCMGKQLTPPDVKFHNSSAKPQRGSWNLRNQRVVRGVAVQKWSVFVIADENVANVNRSLPNLVRICNDMGIKMANPIEVRKCSLNSLEQHVKAKPLELAMVILNDRSASTYQEVKKICDLSAVVVSQCIRKQNVMKLSDGSFCGNIALKINTKLGGTNYTIGENNTTQSLSDDLVLFGCDVTHPGVGDMSSNSIAAVVSSINNTFTNYYTSLKMQPSRQDVIDNLKEITVDHLSHYRQATSRVPKKIIIFRDGIGDSSLSAVYFREIEQIKQAFSALHPDYKPKLTFVVVQKRHSVRFKGDGRGEYVKDQRRGPTCNPAPGTLIDSLGTEYNDFYLISHFALQGTPCPIKYHVLIDEIGIPNLPQFIFDHCHIFSRATKAVSVVPPIYYAHLAAARAKAYVEDDKLIEVDQKLRSVLWYL